MNWRPVDEHLIYHCVFNANCKDCPCRIGCQLRYSFYQDDIEFEKKLQIAELQARRYMSEDNAFEASNSLRKKRMHEISLHPFFSWM